MKLKVTVTKGHTKEAMWCGTPNAIGRTDKHCAIALSLKDVFPFPRVRDMVYVDDKLFSYPIFLPENAIEFINKFDSLSHDPEKRLDPPELEFEIGIPTELIDSINIDDIHNSKNIELVV